VNSPDQIGEMTADAEARISTANIIRLVQTVLVAAVAAFAISVVVAGHWWTAPPPSVDVDAVRQHVVGLMRDQLKTSDAFKDYGITVDDDMMLINTDLNKYTGLATVHTHKGTKKFLEVTVFADPTGAMFYQIDPASGSSLIDTASKGGKPTAARCWGGSPC
jgi:hypothetical protein